MQAETLNIEHPFPSLFDYAWPVRWDVWCILDWVDCQFSFTSAKDLGDGLFSTQVDVCQAWKAEVDSYEIRFYMNPKGSEIEVRWIVNDEGEPTTLEVDKIKDTLSYITATTQWRYLIQGISIEQTETETWSESDSVSWNLWTVDFRWWQALEISINTTREQKIWPKQAILHINIGNSIWRIHCGYDFTRSRSNFFDGAEVLDTVISNSRFTITDTYQLPTLISGKKKAKSQDLLPPISIFLYEELPKYIQAKLREENKS